MYPKFTNDLFSRFTPHFLLFMSVNMCHMDFEDKSTGWTRPPCQKEYVDAVHLRPRPTTPLVVRTVVYF